MRSTNVTWQESTVTRARRWQVLEQQGATVWFTGLPGAGSSTIAAALEAQLIDLGRSAYRLDGDNMRHGVCGDLGFSRSDREKNVWRVGEVARLFADSSAIALVALVSPYASCRQQAREAHERMGSPSWKCLSTHPHPSAYDATPRVYMHARAAASRQDRPASMTPTSHRLHQTWN